MRSPRHGAAPAGRLRARGQPVDGGETLKGYLLRLTEANGYADPSWVEGPSLLPRGYATRPSDLAGLSRLTGVDADRLSRLACWPVPGRAARVAFGPGGPVSPSVLDLVHPKVCVACLREAAWARREWDVAVLLACPRHGVPLLDACTACGSRLAWRRSALARCACGSDLSEPQAEAPARLVALSRMLADLAAGRRPCLPYAAPVRDLDAAARLAWFVASDLSADPGGWRSLHMSKPRVTAAAAAVEAAPVLLDWPGGLHAWLAGRHRPAATGAGVRAAFGAVLHRLMASLRGPGFAFLHEEIRNWLADEWRGGHVKPWSPLFAPRGGARVLSGRQAAERLAVRPDRVAGLIAAGTLGGESRRAGSRRVHLVPVEAVEELERRSAATLPVERVAHRLGVSRGQAARLARSGLLDAAPGLHGRARGRSFEEGALAALGDRLARQASPPPANAGDGRTLAELSRSRRTDFVELLRGVLDGRLAVWRSAAPAAAPVFERYCASPARAVEQRRAAGSPAAPDECLSVREAAAALGMSVRMVPILVGAGCLEAAPAARGGAPRIGKRSITAASVSAFHGRFAMSRELAEAGGTSTRAVVQRLAAAGVVPVVRQLPARGVSAVWRRADCGRAW